MGDEKGTLRSFAEKHVCSPVGLMSRVATMNLPTLSLVSTLGSIS
jgi:hypothetical protein